MQLVAFDPYVSADRARQLGVDLVPTDRGARAPGRLPHHPPAEDARDVGLDLGRAAHPRQADPAHRQHRPRRHRRRGRARRRRARRSDRRRRARRVRGTSPPPSRRCSSSTRSWSRRTSARRRSRPRTRRARPSPSRSCSRCAASSCRSRSTSPRPRRTRPCSRSCRSPSGSVGCSPRWPAASSTRSRSRYEGQIADYDCRVLTLSVLKGVLGPVVDEPVSFVNAPQLAEERGLVVRETTSSSARDYVNLIELRGHTAGAQHARRGHALRQAGRAPHRRHRRLHRRPAAVEPHARRPQRGHAGHGRPGVGTILGDRQRHQHRRARPRPRPAGRRGADGAVDVDAGDRPRWSPSCAAIDGVVDAQRHRARLTSHRRSLVRSLTSRRASRAGCYRLLARRPSASAAAAER